MKLALAIGSGLLTAFSWAQTPPVSSKPQGKAFHWVSVDRDGAARATVDRFGHSLAQRLSLKEVRVGGKDYSRFYGSFRMGGSTYFVRILDIGSGVYNLIPGIYREENGEAMLSYFGSNPIFSVHGIGAIRVDRHSLILSHRVAGKVLAKGHRSETRLPLPEAIRKPEKPGRPPR